MIFHEVKIEFEFSRTEFTQLKLPFLNDSELLNWYP